MAEEKRYLDYDGLAYLVEKLTNKIQAAGGGGTAQGVYVAYTDTSGVNRICDPSDWSSDMGTPAGAVIVAGGRNLLVAPTMSESGLPWCDNTSDGSKDTGGYLTSDSDFARQDFDGRGNTKAAMETLSMSASCAPGFCNAYSYGHVGPGKWWLMGAGESILINRNRQDVNAALTAIGGETLDTAWHWTSTQVSASDAWIADLYADYDNYDIDTGDGKARSSVPYVVRPVSEWVWTESTGGGEL